MSLLDTIRHMYALASLPDGAIRRRFERMARDAQDHTRIVTTLAYLHDIKPSVARELFSRYCGSSPSDWRTCGRFMLTESGYDWMKAQIAAAKPGEGSGE